MVCSEQLPSQEPDFMQPIVGSRQYDEDFQSAKDHADHFHDQGSIVGRWSGQTNGQAHRTQGGGKFKHGLFQTAPGSHGKQQHSGNKQQKVAAHKAHGIGAEFSVNFCSSLGFHIGRGIHTPLGEQLLMSS